MELMDIGNGPGIEFSFKVDSNQYKTGLVFCQNTAGYGTLRGTMKRSAEMKLILSPAKEMNCDALEERDWEVSPAAAKSGRSRACGA